MADVRQDHHDHHDDDQQARDDQQALRYPSDIKSYDLVSTIKTTRNNVVVYKAEFPKHPHAAEAHTHTVAIKAIPFDPKSPAAFTALVRGAEASVSARPHPNLVLARHFFLDAASSRLCAVLPYASSGSVASLTAATTFTASTFTFGLFERGVSAILKGALKALAHLHRLGIPHRDVKPGNILVFRNSGGVNASYTVGLTDFGLSTSFHSPANNADYGGDDDAPYWMAPEAFRSPEDYTTKSDIWAFGVTAMEISFGRPPLSRRVPTSPALRLKIRDRFDMWQYEDTVFNFLWEFSENYIDMVSLCMKKDPSERPTAEELLAHPFFSINAGEDVLLDAFHIRWAMNILPDVDIREKREPEPTGRGLLGTVGVTYRRIAGWELNKNGCFLEAVFDGKPSLSELMDAAALRNEERVWEVLNRMFLRAHIDKDNGGMSSGAAPLLHAAGPGDEARVMGGMKRLARRLEDEEDREAVLEVMRRLEAVEMGRAAAEAYGNELCLNLRKEVERRNHTELLLALKRLR